MKRFKILSGKITLEITAYVWFLTFWLENLLIRKFIGVTH